MIKQCPSKLNVVADRFRRQSVVRLMNPLLVIVLSIGIKFSLKIGSIPEKEAIKVLTPNRTNQSFNERMRRRRIGNTLDLLYVENS